MATRWIRSNYSAGAQDGTSYTDAYNGNTQTNFQTAVNGAGSGGQVYLVGQASFPSAGTFGASLISFTTANASCKITGILDGGGTTVANGSNRPVVTGDWTLAKYNSGSTLITADNQVNGINVQGVVSRNWRRHYYFFNYENDDITLDNIDYREAQDGIWFRGLASVTGATTDNGASHNLQVSNFYGAHFTKRGIRGDHGTYAVTISSGEIDMGGAAYYKEDFMIAYEGGNAGTDSADHDWTFRSVVGRNAYQDPGAGSYWNSDIFSFEDNTFNIRFFGCGAYDSTDGGWDIKWNNTYGNPPTLQDCISRGNARAYRFHSTSNGYAQLTRCLGIFSYLSGGIGSACGIWAAGYVQAFNSTFHDNSDSGASSAQIRIENDNGGGKVELTNCIVSQLSDNTNGIIIELEDSSCFINNVSNIKALTNNGTVVWNPNLVDPSWAAGTSPAYVNGSNIAYEGADTSFNPVTYTSGGIFSKGYYNIALTSTGITASVPNIFAGVKMSGVSVI